ncbi:DSS1/SEM1 family-domain-containing protein [Chlamydoabsidia padenii]|nr:DSS1/SEM1 family-domain-containing protein [Chlamydoabsidia padenii]
MAAPITETAATQDRSVDSTKTAGAQLGALEEDDEFEEFAVEDWAEEEEDKDDTHYWEDNWDDDDIEDDFSQQLKAELEKTSSADTTMM